MATWKKALVVILAALVGVVPVFARISEGSSVTQPFPSQKSIPLPQGDEMASNELLQVEGEIWWLLVAMLFGAIGGAGGGAIYENWFDEDYGIDADDRRSIAGYAVWGAVAGGCGAIGAKIAAR